MVTYRPATLADIRHFARGEKSHSMRAWVVEEGGNLIGLVGFALVSERWYCFFEITDELRKHKTFMVRAAKKLVQAAKDQGIKYLYCDIDWCEPTAFNLVTYLGFELDPRSRKHYRLKFGDT
jgi:hypothetical protein